MHADMCSETISLESPLNPVEIHQLYVCYEHQEESLQDECAASHSLTPLKVSELQEKRIRTKREGDPQSESGALAVLQPL